MYPGNPAFGGQTNANQQQWSTTQQVGADDGDQMDRDESDSARRPPNAFILYSQDMRSTARQENPTLSNTEVSRLLGKMWKEVPNETKLQYKQKASAMQEEFKRQHPDYTYRKARRKRALNELLTKSTQGYPGIPGAPFPGQEIQNQWGSQMMFPQYPVPNQQFSGMMPQTTQMSYPMSGFSSTQPGMTPQMQQPNQTMFQMNPFPNQK